MLLFYSTWKPRTIHHKTLFNTKWSIGNFSSWACNWNVCLPVQTFSQLSSTSADLLMIQLVPNVVQIIPYIFEYVINMPYGLSNTLRYTTNLSKFSVQELIKHFYNLNQWYKHLNYNFESVTKPPEDRTGIPVCI